MMRYLSDYALGMALKRGKTVGHFIGETGGRGPEGRAVLRYLTLESDGAAAVLRAYDVLDYAREDYLDIFSLPEAGDRAQGEPAAEEVFSSPKDALAWADQEFDAAPSEWVNLGVLQDEYADFRS
jgi:hypothetical protein